MARALVIPTYLEQDYYYTEVNALEDYQKIVEGFIEAVTLQQLPGTTMFINEEGKLRELDVNLRASALYNGDLIVGPALLVNVDYHGESIDIPQHNAEIATTIFDTLRVVA